MKPINLQESSMTCDELIKLAVDRQLEMSANFLWLELMDWCKNRREHPAEHNDLFSIVKKLRNTKCEGESVE